MFIRPLKVEDAGLYPDFLAEVTPDDLRLRFFAPMREVSHDLIDKLIHYDPEHAMAFIAIAEASGRMLGVVRLHDDPNGEGGEFAILVRSQLKGHGLGWLMMKHMIAYAKDNAKLVILGGSMGEEPGNRAWAGAGRKRHHAADVHRTWISRRRRPQRTRC